MAQPVTMPKLGFDVFEGTIVRWIKREGDPVVRGDVIAEVETDKAVVEIEATADGVLLTIAAPSGALVPVDGVLAFIGTPGDTTPMTSPPQPAGHVSPIAQRIAAEHDIDLATLTGTGPAGRITKHDVQSALGDNAAPTAGLRAGFPPRTPNAEGKIILGPMGEAIARRTSETMRTIPHFHVNVSVDMTAALQFRREANQTLPGPMRLSINDIIIKAAALTLLKYPVFNSTFEGDHLQVQPHINIGIAVALPQGLIVPAILDCDTKPLGDIARDAKDLAHRAKDSALRQAEYSGTFTISNLGQYGIESFTAVIVAPQVAVLSVSGIKPTPVVVSNGIVIRQIMTATLGIDHRAAHGAEGAQFLAELRRFLETPSLLSM